MGKMLGVRGFRWLERSGRTSDCNRRNSSKGRELFDADHDGQSKLSRCETVDWC